MNARELLHFFQERLCLRAQWEIRALADRMLEIVKARAPAIFARAGPKCVALRTCPEGRRTCGQYAEIVARYGGEGDGGGQGPNEAPEAAAPPSRPETHRA